MAWKSRPSKFLMILAACSAPPLPPGPNLLRASRRLRLTKSVEGRSPEGGAGRAARGGAGYTLLRPETGVNRGDSTSEVRVSDGPFRDIMAVFGPSRPHHSTLEGRIAFFLSRESSATHLGQNVLTFFMYVLTFFCGQNILCQCHGFYVCSDIL